MQVVTRFAPSPTGLLHCGNYRTAVFAYLFARKNNGKFVLRIEDTDTERSKKAYEEDILSSLAWLRLTHDAFYRQRERVEIHTRYLQKLVESGHAYISAEQSATGTERREVIRFKNPNTEVTFHDVIRGAVTMHTEDLGDFVIAKSMTEPLFHLAVVVDDHDMGISHVIRGEDHISNTPRQILIQRAIGAATPTYAHLPLVLAPDRSKLSKRKGAEPITHYRESGFLPEALLNYLALLGWNPGTEQEIFTQDELVQHFDLSRVQKHGAIFDSEKLLWINKQHLATLSDTAFLNSVRSFLPDEIANLPQWSEERFEALTNVFRERITTFGDARTLYQNGELSYFFTRPSLEAGKLSWKKSTAEVTKKHLAHVIQVLAQLTSWDSDSIKSALWDYASAEGRGDVLWPIRYGLSGQDRSPDPFTIASVLGQDETLFRLRQALATIGA